MSSMKDIIGVLILFFTTNVFAISISCNTDSIEDTEILDSLYDSASYVFLANLEIEYLDKSPTMRWKYSLIQPILKGEINSSGYLYLNDHICSGPGLFEKGIILVFFNDANEKISSKNSVLVQYGDGRMTEEWILHWAKDKAYNNTLKGTADAVP